MKTTIQQLTAFFAQPGINVKGICKEAGITEQGLYKRLADQKLPGKKSMGKLGPVLGRYGFKS